MRSDIALQRWSKTQTAGYSPLGANSLATAAEAAVVDRACGHVHVGPKIGIILERGRNPEIGNCEVPFFLWIEGGSVRNLGNASIGERELVIHLGVVDHVALKFRGRPRKYPNIVPPSCSRLRFGLRPDLRNRNIIHDNVGVMLLSPTSCRLFEPTVELGHEVGPLRDSQRWSAGER